MTKRLLFIAHFLAMSLWITAQTNDVSLFSSSGGVGETKTMTLQWTLGDIATSTSSVERMMITEGFLQPRIEIIEIPQVRFETASEALSGKLQIEIWPSPASEYVNIRVKGEANQIISLNLFDMNGHRVLAKSMDRDLERNVLNLGNTTPGNYILKFTGSDGSHLKSFIITKI